MKSIMRAISLGLVCAIATSNVAQAKVFDSLQKKASNAWQKTKDVASKIHPAVIAIPSAWTVFGCLGAGIPYSYCEYEKARQLFWVHLSAIMELKPLGDKFKNVVNLYAKKAEHDCDVMEKSWSALKLYAIAGGVASLGFGLAYLIEKERDKRAEQVAQGN